MSLRGRFAACFSAAAAAALLTAVFAGAEASPTSGPAAPANSNAGASPAEAVTGIPPEVRLRKLHLVRPDLIPYPIAYEVYC